MITQNKLDRISATRDKHSSLLRKSVNYDRKKLYKIGRIKKWDDGLSKGEIVFSSNEQWG
jgi:hypothetical protein